MSEYPYDPEIAARSQALYEQEQAHKSEMDRLTAIWHTMRANDRRRLEPVELEAEIAYLERERAILADDLARRAMGAEGALVLAQQLSSVHYTLDELWDLATLRGRAGVGQVGVRVPRPDFARARDVDLVGIAETLTGQTAVPTGQGRHRIRCPFHDDDNPSLVIYPPGRGWYCFVCQTGGHDAVSFVAAVRHCSQTEALRLIAQLADLPGVA